MFSNYQIIKLILWKATKLYQDVCKEKDTVLGKLTVLERNKRTLIEDNDMLNKKHKEALKVGCDTTAIKECFMIPILCGCVIFSTGQWKEQKSV